MHDRLGAPRAAPSRFGRGDRWHAVLRSSDRAACDARLEIDLQMERNLDQVLESYRCRRLACQLEFRRRVPLSARERELLDFAHAHPNAATGPVERLIREQLGLSPTHYWQQMNVLIGRREALEYNAQTVHRLQRLRDARRSRAGR